MRPIILDTFPAKKGGPTNIELRDMFLVWTWASARLRPGWEYETDPTYTVLCDLAHGAKAVHGADEDDPFCFGWMERILWDIKDGIFPSEEIVRATWDQSPNALLLVANAASRHDPELRGRMDRVRDQVGHCPDADRTANRIARVYRSGWDADYTLLPIPAAEAGQFVREIERRGRSIIDAIVEEGETLFPGFGLAMIDYCRHTATHANRPPGADFVEDKALLGSGLISRTLLHRMWRAFDVVRKASARHEDIQQAMDAAFDRINPMLAPLRREIERSGRMLEDVIFAFLNCHGLAPESPAWRGSGVAA